MWQRSHKTLEDRKLELRLGPPGEEFINEDMKNVKRERDESSLTLGSGGGPILPSAYYHQQNSQKVKAKASSFLQLPSRSQNIPVMGKDMTQTSCADLQNAEKNAFSPSSSNTAVSNRSQKRNAPSPVVGWPPIRSFRKNIANGNSSKPPQHVVPDKVTTSDKPIANSGKGLFVKVNMDGVPIGRKVDINAYGSYEKLSSAIDELFRDLLVEINLSHIVFSHCGSVQKDSSAGGTHNNQEEQKAIKGLVKSGEYTLVYEDNEGDKMLVGDVPWHMFVSTVKRLRVLKSSDLPTFTYGR